MIRAAQWAVSDRQAALLICLVVQQRIVAASRLSEAWTSVARSPRRALLSSVIADVCDGAHSLGELDFARLCRRHGLPAPSRQAMRQGAQGTWYLDVYFDEAGLVVEIDGGQHYGGLAPVQDALRQNELTLTNDRVLRIPLLGLRIAEAEFMAQVAGALRAQRPAA